MTHIRFATCFCIAIGLLIVSCSSTSQMNTTTEDTSTQKSVYPSWYSSNRTLESEDGSFNAYATAVASDSNRSATKAGNQAKAVLESAVSNRLESIRTDAAVELGSDSGVDSPKFIIALRNAESKIGSVAEVAETDVSQSDNGTFRGFARASVEKEVLLEELDRALAANGNAWNAMKESQAFTDF